jgi:hypothetical protein
MKSFFTHLLAFFAGIWAGNPDLRSMARHAIITFVTVDVTPFLAEVERWANGGGIAPDWLMFARNLSVAAILGAVAFFVRGLAIVLGKQINKLKAT